MKSKLKLELIEKYISLHNILIICKQRIFRANTKLETLIAINTTANNLKLEFESCFDFLKMNNEALIILKKELNLALNSNVELSNTPGPEKLINRMCNLKKEKEKILQKLIKKKKRWVI